MVRTSAQQLRTAAGAASLEDAFVELTGKPLEMAEEDH